MQHDHVLLEVSTARSARWSPKLLIGAALAIMVGAVVLATALSSSSSDAAAGYATLSQSTTSAGTTTSAGATQLHFDNDRNEFAGEGQTWNCTNVLDWNFFNATVTQNNLGGLGPNMEDQPEIRYSGVGHSIDGHPIDMVVTAKNYNSLNTSINGLWHGQHGAGGSFGQINIRGNTETLVKFQLVKAGSDTPFDITETEKIVFSMYDFDKSNPDGKYGAMYEFAEFVTPVASHSVAANTTVLVSGGEDGEGPLSVKSTRQGNVEDNPTDPLSMSQLQLNSKVSVTYVGKGAWEVLMGAPGANPKAGRNLLFAGRSEGDCACVGLSDWTLHENLQYNNLGGKGPVTSDPEELRYSKVFTTGYERQPIDLVIKVAEGSTYSPYNTARNGLNPEPSDHPQMGQININSGSETTFDLMFVASGTDDPVDLSNVLFSVYDFDENYIPARGRNPASPNHEYVIFPQPVTNWTLTHDPPTIVLQSGQNDGTLRFTSTKTGGFDDNPTNPYQLTMLQRSKSVTVWYADTSKFQVTFGHEYVGALPRKEKAGRNILFAGPGIYCPAPSPPPMPLM